MAACAASVSFGCTPEQKGCIDAAALWGEPPDGPICIHGDLVITGRSEAELAALQRVETIEGSLRIFDNPGLEVLPAFASLAIIEGSLSISDNEDLAVIEGFPVLTAVEGELYLGENAALLEFTLGPGVAELDDLFVALNPRLTRIGGMPGLSRVNGDVLVIGHEAAKILEYPALTTVAGDFVLHDNLALTALDLPALTDVTGRCSLRRNAALASITGVPSLARVDEVNIGDNDQLTAIEWMGPLELRRLDVRHNARLERIRLGGSTASAGDIIVVGNPMLHDIAGFTDVETVVRLEIRGNGALRELAAFSGLTEIIGDLQLIDNPSLIGPESWFPALKAAGGLWIYRNLSLPPQVVDALEERLVVGGTPRVGDNGGENTMLEPCPWPEDGICDADWGWNGRGTGLCASDQKDCAAP
ncbi:Receptor L domain-containing protein [Nannocystis exedens]|uniref:Receptor L domain-containing protein n=1 Tax=Nannocystis exedens TaxID=54 RepID=A0A1I1U705_9BACT|nr:hypothetical protein [Nannocystis exedens]PCC71480.1 T9SS C-terminal target domain-containing protein [Nannocystis exedens]SFD66567.1 Receptor L domain-containing protein [Nannocystis exedens]